MTKILVTGASGFVGSHIVQYLCEKNRFVLGISRRQSKYIHKNYTHLRTDLLEADIATLITEHNVSAIIHLASAQPAQIACLEDALQSNTILTERLLKSAATINTFIYASTMSVYGAPQALPVTTNAAIPMERLDDYALSKILAEALMDRYHRDHQRFFTLRLASIFGKGHNGGIAHYLYSNLKDNKEIELFSKGKTLKELIHIDDVVDIIWACLQQRQTQKTLLNVGYGEKLQFSKMASFMKEKLSSKSKIILSDNVSNRNFDFYFDASPINRELNIQLGNIYDRLSQYCTVDLRETA